MDREEKEVRGLIKRLMEEIKEEVGYTEGFCQYGMTDKCENLCLDSEPCYLKDFYRDWKGRVN